MLYNFFRLPSGSRLPLEREALFLRYWSLNKNKHKLYLV